MTMSLHDGAINAGREAEIVSVDDEAPHAAIVARCGCCGCGSRFDRHFRRRVYSKASLFSEEPLNFNSAAFEPRKAMSSEGGG